MWPERWVSPIGGIRPEDKVNVEMVSRTDERTSLEEPGLRGAWRTSRGPDTTEDVPNSPHQAFRSREGDHTADSCGSCRYHRFPAADWPVSGQRHCNLQAGQLNNNNKNHKIRSGKVRKLTSIASADKQSDFDIRRSFCTSVFCDRLALRQ